MDRRRSLSVVEVGSSTHSSVEVEEPKMSIQSPSEVEFESEVEVESETELQTEQGA